MKWFQAMAKGAGDQYLNIRDQEREHISKMAQIKAQYDGDALKKEKENALLFNTNFGEYTLKDDPAVSGDKWMTRENKVNAFTRDFKSWFMDGDEVNRKGALDGGFRDERRSRLRSYVGIKEARAELEPRGAVQGGGAPRRQGLLAQRATHRLRCRSGTKERS